jgi:uncharacterized protein (DUF2141 family)
MKTIMLALTYVTLTVCWCAAQTPQVSVGVISGTVRGEDGTIIDSGVVSAFGVPDSSKSKNRRTSATTMIAFNGSFNFPPLEPGKYRLCVQVPGAWMNPCEWGSNALTISVSPDQPSGSANVVLRKEGID